MIYFQNLNKQLSDRKGKYKVSIRDSLNLQKLLPLQSNLENMDSKTPIMIIGTGNEARVALDAANTLEVVVYGFLTDDESMLSKELNDVLVISKLGKQDAETLLEDENMKLVIAIKDLEKRKEIIEDLKIDFFSYF